MLNFSFSVGNYGKITPFHKVVYKYLFLRIPKILSGTLNLFSEFVTECFTEDGKFIEGVQKFT